MKLPSCQREVYCQIHEDYVLMPGPQSNRSFVGFKMYFIYMTVPTNHEYFISYGRSRIQLNWAERFGGYVSKLVLPCALVVKPKSYFSLFWRIRQKDIPIAYLTCDAIFFCLYFFLGGGVRLLTNSIY